MRGFIGRGGGCDGLPERGTGRTGGRRPAGVRRRRREGRRRHGGGQAVRVRRRVHARGLSALHRRTRRHHGRVPVPRQPVRHHDGRRGGRSGGGAGSELRRPRVGRRAPDRALTGGLESAVTNTLSPGDRVVVPVAGYFGERFAKIAAAFGADVRRIDYEWGRAIDAGDVEEALAEAPAKAVLCQQSETSTGVIHDVEAIARVTKAAGALMIVDAVSSLGAVPF